LPISSIHAHRPSCRHDVPGSQARAEVTLLMGGGFTALQAMAISSALPFTIVLLVAGYSLVSGLISRAALSITCKDQPGGFAQITSVRNRMGNYT
jgi:choline-glycine betaine transporter